MPADAVMIDQKRLGATRSMCRGVEWGIEGEDVVRLDPQKLTPAIPHLRCWRRSFRAAALILQPPAGEGSLGRDSHWA